MSSINVEFFRDALFVEPDGDKDGDIETHLVSPGKSVVHQFHQREAKLLKLFRPAVSRREFLLYGVAEPGGRVGHPDVVVLARVNHSGEIKTQGAARFQFLCRRGKTFRIPQAHLMYPAGLRLRAQ